MSPFRDAASRIWPGAPVWARYLALQELATGKRERGINHLEITVYARARSVRSWRVERLLRRRGYAFKMVVDVAEDGEPGSRLPNTDGWGMAPQVFVDGRRVGGLRELRALDCSGDLARLVHGEV
jgi:glutaredoxin-related protein